VRLCSVTGGLENTNFQGALDVHFLPCNWAKSEVLQNADREGSLACQVLSFEAEMQLLKEQKQSDMRASETHEKTLLEKYKVWRTKFN
jgi:hypothetical protein